MQNGKSNGYDDEEDSEGMHSLPTRCIEDPIKAEPCKPDAPLPGSTVLRMYSHPGCPFSHSVRLVLAAKNIDYHLVNIDPDDTPDWLLELTQVNRLPVIVHGGHSVFDAEIICEYLEEMFTIPNLYNRNIAMKAKERYVIHQWMNKVQRYYAPNTKGVSAFFSLLHAGEFTEEVEHNLLNEIRWLQSFMQANNSSFFLQQTAGMADFFIWPWFERLSMLAELKGYQLDPVEFEPILSWLEKMSKHSDVVACKMKPETFSKYCLEFNANTSLEDYHDHIRNTVLDDSCYENHQ